MNRSTLALAALLLALGSGWGGALRAEDSESPPGRQPSAKCAAAELTFDLADAAAQGATLTAAGRWKVGGTADGLLLELRVNGNRYHGELQHGGAGRYAYATDFGQCGLQVVRVFACPTVREGGREVQCLARGRSVAKNLHVDCTPSARILRCTWECADDPRQGCAGTCTADAAGGEQNLVGLWGVDDKNYEFVAGPPHGPWMAVVRCKPGERVSFRARDQAGLGSVSPVAEKPCGVE
jgi:hypothetical protein